MTTPEEKDRDSAGAVAPPRTAGQPAPAASGAEPIWWLTKDGDKSCIALYERHYSCYHYADGRRRTQFVGPGESIVLRTGTADALFVWRNYIDDTIPKQEGVECAVFRNETEGRHLSSELIRQADAIADVAWAGARHYTKVRPSAVGSANPGYCFIRAGWRRCGHTKNGLLILERKAEGSSAGLPGARSAEAPPTPDLNN